MKKIIALLLSLIMIVSAFTLVSCKDKNGEESGEPAPSTKTLTILGYNFSVSSALSEMSLNVVELSHMSIYADNATGAKLVVTGSGLPDKSAEEMNAMYPQNAEEAKKATAVSAIYTYDDYVYEKTSYGCKFFFKVDMLGELSYRTAYCFVDGNTYIMFEFEEKDAARPCGENFAFIAS